MAVIEPALKHIHIHSYVKNVREYSTIPIEHTVPYRAVNFTNPGTSHTHTAWMYLTYMYPASLDERLALLESPTLDRP